MRIANAKAQLRHRAHGPRVTPNIKAFLFKINQRAEKFEGILQAEKRPAGLLTLESASED